MSLPVQAPPSQIAPVRPPPVRTAPLPVYYSLNGNTPRPVPAPSRFGFVGRMVGKPVTAETKGDALYELKVSSVKIPYGFRISGVYIESNKYIVDMRQNGGKSRKSRKSRKSKSVKRSKTQRFRRR